MISLRTILIVAAILVVLWAMTDAPTRASFVASAGGGGLPLHPTEYRGSAFAPQAIG